MKKKKKRYLFTTLLAVVLVWMLILVILPIKSFVVARDVTFTELEGRELSAKIIKSSSDTGVFIATDKMWTKSQGAVLSSVLSSMGYSVFIFDWPSSGGSGGKAALNYKQNEDAAAAFYSALVAFSQSQSLAIENIHIIAFGYGARAAIQASQKVSIKPKSMTLISPEINLEKSLQFDILNFSEDKDVDFINSFFTSNTFTKINLIRLSLDEDFTKKQEDAFVLKLKENNFTYQSALVSGVFRPLAAQSIKVVREISTFISGVDKTSYEIPSLIKIRPILVFLIYLCLLSIGYIFFLELKFRVADFAKEDHLTPPKNFIKKKLLCWIISFAISVAILCFLYVSDVAFVYYDCIRILLFGVYGVVCFFLYSYSNFFFALDNATLRKTQIRGVLVSFIGFLIYLLLFYFLKIGGVLSEINLLNQKALLYIVLFLLFSFVIYIDTSEKELFATNKKEFLIISLLNYMGAAVMIAVSIVFLRYTLFWQYFYTFICLIIAYGLQRTLRELNVSSMTASFFSSGVFLTGAFAVSMIFV